MSVSDSPARDSLDGQESVGELLGAVFGLAEDIASQVSPGMMEARLRRTIRRAARQPGSRALAEAPARSPAGSGSLLLPDGLEGALPASVSASRAPGTNGQAAAVAAAGAVAVAPAPGTGFAPAGARTAAGRDSDLAAAYAGHYTSLVRLAALLTGDVPAAEEAVQDAFAAVHGGGRRHATGQDEALACLRQAVVNWSRSVLGHRLAAGRVPAPLPHVPGGGRGAISLLERSAVIAALRRLPPRQHEALVLRYYADLSEAQTAAAMGISSRAVHRHTARAMAALGPVLGPQA